MKKHYLGDGLFAQDDGFNVVLSTSRETGLHFVALEPEVLQSFFNYLENARDLIITVERKPKIPTGET